MLSFHFFKCKGDIFKPVKSQKNETRPKDASENEYVTFVECILDIIFEDSGLRVRTGEHGAANVKDDRKKVDLIVERGDENVSITEFARSDSKTTIKYWRDRSKILRLNQLIHNLLAKYGKSKTAGMQFTGRFGELLILDLIDHGLYVVDSAGQFEIPSSAGEVMEKLPALTLVFFYFKDIVESKKMKKDVKVNSFTGKPLENETTKFITMDPIWTKPLVKDGV